MQQRLLICFSLMSPKFRQVIIPTASGEYCFRLLGVKSIAKARIPDRRAKAKEMSALGYSSYLNTFPFLYSKLWLDRFRPTSAGVLHEHTSSYLTHGRSNPSGH